MSLVVVTVLVALVVLSSAVDRDGDVRDKRYLVAKLVLENVPGGVRLSQGRGPQRHYRPGPFRRPYRHQHHGNLFHHGGYYMRESFCNATYAISIMTYSVDFVTEPVAIDTLAEVSKMIVLLNYSPMTIPQHHL